MVCEEVGGSDDKKVEASDATEIFCLTTTTTKKQTSVSFCSG
jgi:hypothetical protein